MNATVFGFDSRVAFTALVGLVALQRLWELRISARNLRAMRARGGFEVGAEHYPWMVALHVAFLVSCVAELWLFHRPWIPQVAAGSALVLVAAQGLRWWTLHTLGDRWSTHVMVVPGEAPITSGPYRWMRHPNYVAVVVEIAAIPMLHCAWLTALVFSIINLGLLGRRIAVEEGALSDHCDYDEVFRLRRSGGGSR